jgi:four helix bundle protein
MAFAKSFTELKVWQEAHSLVLQVYKVTGTFPKSESFGLTSQLQRAIVSVTSNITEGFERGSRKEFIQFLIIARGSLAESQNQLLIARDLQYISPEKFKELADQSVGIHKSINALIRSLRSPKPANQRTSN